MGQGEAHDRGAFIAGHHCRQRRDLRSNRHAPTRCRRFTHSCRKCIGNGDRLYYAHGYRDADG
jgi:hypothetical protein